MQEKPNLTFPTGFTHVFHKVIHNSHFLAAESIRDGCYHFIKKASHKILNINNLTLFTKTDTLHFFKPRIK